MADEFDDWADDPIVAALTSPAGPGELDGQAEALAGFRAAAPRRLRLVRRLGTGGAAVAVTLVVTGGVAAAAYTSALPAPLQAAFHHVLGDFGVPPAQHHHHRRHFVDASGPVHTAVATTPAMPSPEPSTASASSTPSAHPTQSSPAAIAPAGAHSSTPSPSAATSEPAASPSSSTTPSPTATPTPTPTSSTTPAPAPAAVTASVSRAKVAPGGQVLVSATIVDASGDPVRHHRCHIFEKLPGGSWQVVTVAKTNAKGIVHGTEGPLQTNAKFLVRSGGIASVALPVVVAPSLTISVAPDDSAKTDAVTISAVGAQPGDAVKALRKVDGKWQLVASGTLGSDGSLTVTVHEPQKSAKRLLIVLTATADHGRATGKAVLQPPAS